MDCDYILLFRYMEGRVTPEEAERAERMIAENAECREHLERFKPVLDTLRPFWPQRKPCPNSWNLVQYLYGDLKDPELIRSMEAHIERCRFCRSIRESYQEYRKIPDHKREIEARELSTEARKSLEELKKRYS